MYKFLNSGEIIDPLDVLREIYDSIPYLGSETYECECGEDVDIYSPINGCDIEQIINKIEIQRLSNDKINSC